MLHGEPRARPAEARHHLIGDEQHVVAIADLADALKVAVGRRHATHGRADDRLGDEASHVLGPVPADHPLELVGAAQAARGAISAAIGIRRRDLGHVVDHRRVLAPPTGVAAEARRPKRHPMEALPARDDHVLVGSLVREPVLARELDRGFGHLRAAVEQRHMVQLGRSDLGDMLR